MPIRGEIVAFSETLPEKPVLFKLMVEVANPPATVLRLAGLAETVKSGVMVTVTMVEFVTDPLIAVMFTAYFPEGVDAVVPILNAEVAVPPAINETGLVVKEKVTPGIGVEVVAESVTLPEKLLILLSVTSDVSDVPAVKGPGVLVEIPIS